MNNVFGQLLSHLLRPAPEFGGDAVNSLVFLVAVVVFARIFLPILSLLRDMYRGNPRYAWGVMAWIPGGVYTDDGNGNQQVVPCAAIRVVVCFTMAVALGAAAWNLAVVWPHIILVGVPAVVLDYMIELVARVWKNNFEDQPGLFVSMVSVPVVFVRWFCSTDFVTLHPLAPEAQQKPKKKKE